MDKYSILISQYRVSQPSVFRVTDTMAYLVGVVLFLAPFLSVFRFSLFFITIGYIFFVWVFLVAVNYFSGTQTVDEEKSPDYVML